MSEFKPEAMTGLRWLASTREAQARIYEEFKGLTTEDLIAYFKGRVEKGPFAEWWASMKCCSSP